VGERGEGEMFQYAQVLFGGSIYPQTNTRNQLPNFRG
jgi:hypothetical protein